jgi:class 3 adenylate cyclase
MTYLDFFPIPMSNSAVVTASLMAGAASFMLGIGYLGAELRSPATRAFAVTALAGGIAIAFTSPLAFLYESGATLSWFLRFPIFELMAYLGQGAWLLLVARTAQPGPRMRAWIIACVWTSWATALVYFVVAVLFPVDRMTELMCLVRGQDCATEGFRRFAVPLAAAIAAYNIGLISLLTQRIDRAERVRVNFVVLAVLFGYGPYYLPLGYGAISALIGILIMAIGFIRYYGMQAERGVFMSRFLSSEVSKLVRDKGIEHTMQPQALEVTAVCCDLRGFTRLSQLLASDQVIRLLNEYYDAIGKVVAEFGATIKDYAGDGVLILVGAPVALKDHAQQGLAMARRLQQAASGLIEHWAGPEMKLGFGVGVASGRVTVGAVGSSSRMEYTAVGPTVNLASRLCSQAADGEVLVDARTAELVGNTGLEARGALAVKGMGEAPHFACATARH